MKKQSSAKGFTILSAANIINKLLGLLYVPVVTLIIGNYGNGIREQGFKFYELAFVITNTGIPIALSKIISEQLASSRYRLSYKTLRVSAMLLISGGLFTSVLTAVLAGPVSNLMHFLNHTGRSWHCPPPCFYLHSMHIQGYFRVGPI